jgi:hypothetical protein
MDTRKTKRSVEFERMAVARCASEEAAKVLQKDLRKARERAQQSAQKRKATIAANREEERLNQ